MTAAILLNGEPYCDITDCTFHSSESRSIGVFGQSIPFTLCEKRYVVATTKEVSGAGTFAINFGDRLERISGISFLYDFEGSKTYLLTTDHTEPKP